MQDEPPQRGIHESTISKSVICNPIKRAVSSVGSEHLVYTEGVGGSSPSLPTGFLPCRYSSTLGKVVSRNTTLVLGAGASVPYGFPTGRGLLVDVLKTLKARAGNDPKHSYYRLVADISGKSDKFIEEFATELDGSAISSVDAFLENRDGEFLRLGKVAMAVELIPLERENRLGRVWEDNNRELGPWLGFLWEHARAKPDQFSDNGLSIITFNYDRSVEAFLHKAFRFSYGISQEDAMACLRHIDIVHVHGDLLPFSLNESMLGRPFGATKNLDVIAAAADRIVVQFEGAAESTLARAKELLSAAEVIGVLGFGYAEQNVERLAFRSQKGNPRIYLMGYGLRTRELQLARDAIQKYWKRQDSSFSFRILPPNDLTCEQFLREFRVLA